MMHEREVSDIVVIMVVLFGFALLQVLSAIPSPHKALYSMTKDSINRTARVLLLPFGEMIKWKIMIKKSWPRQKKFYRKV